MSRWCGRDLDFVSLESFDGDARDLAGAAGRVMMSGMTRRAMLSRWGMVSASAVTAGFTGLQLFHRSPRLTTDPVGVGYGDLVDDPRRMIDLPRGFSYSIISTVGDNMDDGLVVPGAPDGMAAFAGPDGLTVIVRNHELNPDHSQGPFGRGNRRLGPDKKGRLYDWGEGQTPGLGGTTTLVYDTGRQQLVRQFLSLAGTHRNCAGGPTPWGSWVSCEETVQRVGRSDRGEDFVASVDHGYVFEVPATAKIGLVEPEPIREMGRFNHEAIAVDPRSGVVYLTEDRDDGLLYRFIPRTPAKLHEGGRLQALAILGEPSSETCNWERQWISVRERRPVEWVDMDLIDSPDDDLRARGFIEKGAARFARGEGIWYGDRELFFACTSGGQEQLGQIWRYVPSKFEGQPGESENPGQLELFIEPDDPRLLKNADNLTVSPWGDLVVCEDRKEHVVRLLGVTPGGTPYTLAHSHLRTELAGATFSPDGSTLFFNAQGRGLTFAVTGPWKSA
ncbi:MAG: DUF839 domain-containing protein [Planctomycetaceae bacterium]|nr:DUF839 domain-containing protein [Planctomycetaceae bacterium]